MKIMQNLAREINRSKWGILRGKKKIATVWLTSTWDIEESKNRKKKVKQRLSLDRGPLDGFGGGGFLYLVGNLLPVLTNYRIH